MACYVVFVVSYVRGSSGFEPTESRLVKGTRMLTLSIDHRILNEATHVDVLSCCFSHKVSVIHLCS